jgi:outer membrane protein
MNFPGYFLAKKKPNHEMRKATGMKLSNVIKRSKSILLSLFGLCLALSPATFGQETGEPLTLEKAVSLALDGNDLIKAVRAEVDASMATVRMANSNYLPRLNYDYSIARGNNPVFVFGTKLMQNRFGMEDFFLSSLNNPTPINNFQSKFSASQMIFDFGRTRHGVAMAKLGQKSSEKELEKTKSDLIFRVVKTYLDALLAQEFVKVAEAAVESADADLSRAENMFNGGMTVESDLLSVKVHKASQMEELVKARNNLKLASSALNFEMGLPLGKNFELARVLKPVSPELASLAEYQKVALEQRPDYKQADLMTESGDLAVRSSKSNFWPMVSAFGQWETDQQSMGSSAGNNYIYGINVHFNIFNGRSDQARLAESSAQQLRAAAMRDHLGKAVLLQVQKAFLDWETAKERLEVTRQAEVQAEEGLRIVKNRFENGLTTVTDLLRSELALTGSRSSQLRAIFDQWVSVANLELQSGRLSPSSHLLVE